jgi:hypothetical protein
MKTVMWILEFSSYAVLLYLGWLMFDTFIKSRIGKHKGGRK